MSQQRADVAGMDAMHIMQFNLVWQIYQIILRIHRSATVKNLLARKIIQFVTMRTYPVAADNTDDNLLLKGNFLSFQSTVATFYR